MSSTPTSLFSSALPTTSVTTAGGAIHIDLNYATAMAKGSGSIFLTDGAVQTVIDRVTGQPKLRVVGGSYSKEITLDQVSINGTHVGFDAIGLPPGVKLNVYMAAGTLTSSGQAAPAITVPDKASFIVPGVALGATIAVEDRTLKAGTDIKITLSFSKALATLDPAALSADHAAVNGIAASSDGRTWTITLGAADSVESLTNALRLDMGKLISADGTRGSGVLTSSNYLVDTVVDSHVGAQITLVHDLGASAADGLTADDRQVVSGTLVGTIDAGEHLELVIGTRTVDASKISFATVDGVTTWRYDSADERVGDAPAHVFGEGANTILARVVGNGHASPAATRTITVDTTAPGASGPDSETPVALGTAIVIRFTEAMHWSADPAPEDPDYPNDALVLWQGDAHQNIAFDPAWLTANGLELSIPASALALMGDSYYHLVLPRTLTDLAGNPLGEYEINFHTEDDHAPSASYVSLYGTRTWFRAGEEILFRVQFDEEVRTVGDSLPALILSNGRQARLAGVDGDELVFSYTVAAGDDTNDLTIADVSELVGNVEDLSGNLLDEAHIVFDGIFDGYGSLVDIKLDTLAPATPGLATLAPGSDTHGGGVSSTRTPTLAGTAEAGASVLVYDGATLLGTVAAEAVTGAWTLPIASWTPLDEGRHDITVVQRDHAGNQSDASANFVLTIDTSIPQALAAPTLASDTGLSPVDRITRETQPGLSGSGAEPFATVKIMKGSEVVGSGSADKDGNWSASFAAPLADGAHTVTVRQHDAAGHVGADSPALSFTVDATRPTAPGAPLLAAASDSGILDNDGITNDITPTFSGAGAEADATIVLFAGSREIGRTTADGSGHWDLTVLEADKFTIDGSYAVTARQIDKAGNTSEASHAFALVIDTLGPTVSSFLSKTASREAQLGFTEQIVFKPTGMFKLFDAVTSLLSLSFNGNSGGPWYVSDGDGGHNSVLNFKISVNGLYNLHMNNESVQDLAGNVAIIGSPQWVVDLPPPSA